MEEVFVYDLWGRMRKDSKFRSRVTDSVNRLASVERNFRHGKTTGEAMSKALADTIAASGYNYGMIVPFIFRQYPKDKPLSYLERPFMFAMSCMAPGSVVTHRAGRQVGKCADGRTRVLTNRGQTTLAELFDQGRPVADGEGVH